jgi:hypothetical protein
MVVPWQARATLKNCHVSRWVYVKISLPIWNAPGPRFHRPRLAACTVTWPVVEFVSAVARTVSCSGQYECPL